MTKAVFNIHRAPKAPDVTLKTMKALVPALVTSIHSKELVVIAVHTSGVKDRTYLCMTDGVPLQWISDPDAYTFVRYLEHTESVTIHGGYIK